MDEIDWVRRRVSAMRRRSISHEPAAWAAAMVPDDLSEVLSEFARTMVTDFPIQDILDHLVSRIVDVMPVSAAGVTLITSSLQPRYVAASDAAALRYEELQSELGEGPCLAAYESGAAVLVPDLLADRRFPTFTPKAIAAGLGAVFTFPLNHGELRLGALDLYRDAPGPLSSAALRAAQTLAAVAAAYLINAQARADLQESSDLSRKASLHDALTGLPNRVLLLERLHHAFLRGRRTGNTSAVFFIDLDRFKAINDAHGHEAGDELLVALGERLTGVLRPGDTLARLAGDEFVILCEDLEDPEQADAIAVRIAGGMELPFLLAAGEVKITASIGISLTGSYGDSPEQLLRAADRAMYRTKRHNHGQSHVFDLHELHDAEHEATLERSLPGAAARGELQLAHQPIVVAGDGRITAVEALLRWNHPSRGPIAPSILVPLAEQSGLISELGVWVLQQACTDHRQWQSQRPDATTMAVNVSSSQFMAPGFVNRVAAVLADASMDPGALTLEVTESVLVVDAERALVVFQQLRDIGVRLALDDFGTGYSSLKYLMRFRVDTVKIDQAFIAGLGRKTASRTIVKAIIQLAHNLGMKVVAEGVETDEQRNELIELGCDFCQGFYFARPMPAARVSALMLDGSYGSPRRLPAHTELSAVS